MKKRVSYGRKTNADNMDRTGMSGRGGRDGNREERFRKCRSMRIAGAIFLALILTGLTASAGSSGVMEDSIIQEETSKQTSEIGSIQPGQVWLGIDTVHVYENMEESYSQGYIPKVGNGVVHLVVPFFASGPLQSDRLTVELDMEEGAPFVYANYRREVPGKEFSFHEPEEISVKAYVFSCDIVLEPDRRNGKYPVTVKAVGYSEAGRRAELSSRIFITVSDGIENLPPGSGTEKPPGQADPQEPGTEKLPDQTDPQEPDTEKPPDQTDSQEPGTEKLPDQSDLQKPGTEEPSEILPEGPGNNGDSSKEENRTGQPGMGDIDIGESSPGDANAGEAVTEEPVTKEPDTEASFSEDSGGGGYFGGGYAGGGDYAGGSTERIHRQPKFLLISDSLDGRRLTAGQEYDFTTVFQNMTGNESVYNLKVTLKSESDAIDFGCSSFYFGQVREQETVILSTYLTVTTNAQTGKVPAVFTFEYENDQGTSYTAAEEVELDLYQPSQVVLDGFRLAPQVYSTDTVDIGFAVRNAGKSAVYNVQVEFSGQGLFATETVFAGVLEAGVSCEDKLRIYVGNMAMESLSDTDTSDGELYGETMGILTLTYEDAYGEVYTQTQEYATEILEPKAVELSVGKPEEKTNQWQAAVFLMAVIFSLLIFALLGWRLRKSRKALADLIAAQQEKRG